MSYLGGGPYYIETCPLCGELMWNGRCENLDCEYHWYPKEDDECDDARTLGHEGGSLYDNLYS